MLRTINRLYYKEITKSFPIRNVKKVYLLFFFFFLNFNLERSIQAFNNNNDDMNNKNNEMSHKRHEKHLFLRSDYCFMLPFIEIKPTRENSNLIAVSYVDIYNLCH